MTFGRRRNALASAASACGICPRCRSAEISESGAEDEMRDCVRVVEGYRLAGKLDGRGQVALVTVRIVVNHPAHVPPGSASASSRAARLTPSPSMMTLPAVFGGLGMEELGPQRFEASQRSRLVLAHHPRVADDVGRDDRREPALDPFLGHSSRVSKGCAGGLYARGACKSISAEARTGPSCGRLSAVGRGLAHPRPVR